MTSIDHDRRVHARKDDRHDDGRIPGTHTIRPDLLRGREFWRGRRAGTPHRLRAPHLAEIGKIAGGSAIEIDPSASGVDDNGGDNCVWKVKGNPNPFIVFQVKRVPANRQIEAAFGVDRVEAFGGGPAPAGVSGLGDEALYRDFERVKGGCLLVRQARSIVSFSGPVGRDAYVTLARLVLQRL